MAGNSRCTPRIIALIAVAATAFYIYGAVYHFRPFPSHRTETLYASAPLYNRTPPINSSNATTDIPRILVWTPFFGSRLLGLSAQDEVEIPECSRRCHVTYNRDRLSSSDAVVFHVRDLRLTDMPLRRAPTHKWVFWSMESPPHSHIEANNMKSMFNWTMTYRADSDIPLPYGVVKIRENDTGVTLYNKTLWQQKKKTAVWVVSNCATESRREDFVKELQRYIDIDVYGRCGTHKCPVANNDACLREFESEYYFWLALENSLCRDYVTEKLFSALQHSIVPVALGAANYSAISAPHSVIDVSSFEGPKELADYMQRVKSDFQLYKGYLEWKDRYDVVRWSPTFCSLCEKLHSVHFRTASVYEDLWSWWFKDSGCYSWNDEHWRTQRNKRRNR